MVLVPGIGRKSGRPPPGRKGIFNNNLANQRRSDLYSIPHRSIPEKTAPSFVARSGDIRVEQQFSSIFLAFTPFSCILGGDVTPAEFLFQQRSTAQGKIPCSPAKPVYHENRRHY
jgi:hypothetical protein